MMKFYGIIPMGRIGALSLLLICFFSELQAQPQTNVNIITNGGAESVPIMSFGWSGTDMGTQSGYADQGPWYLPDSSSYAADLVGHGAHGGKYFFSAGVQPPNPGPTAFLSQTIDLNALSLTGQDLYFTFSGWVSTSGDVSVGADIAEIKVEYLSGGVSLAQYLYDVQFTAADGSDVGWHNLTNIQHVLASDNVDQIQVSLLADHENGFYPSAIFYDDLSLVATTTLPVSLLDFSAVQKPDHTVELQWQTAQEQNSRYFEVQRSSNGKDFISIGQVVAAGNSQAVSHYSFVDASPLSGNSFYRLKPVDLDGSYKYSKIVRIVGSGGSKTVEVFSNPFHDQLGLRIASAIPDRLVFTLVDLSGRTCWQQTYSAQTGNNFVNLYPPAGIAAGMYMLQIKGAHTNQTIKVLKQ